MAYACAEQHIDSCCCSPRVHIATTCLPPYHSFSSLQHTALHFPFVAPIFDDAIFCVLFCPCLCGSRLCCCVWMPPFRMVRAHPSTNTGQSGKSKWTRFFFGGLQWIFVHFDGVAGATPHSRGRCWRPQPTRSNRHICIKYIQRAVISISSIHNTSMIWYVCKQTHVAGSKISRRFFFGRYWH